MLDLILFLALASVFGAGFWSGAKYGTVGAMATDIKARIKKHI